MVNDIGKRLLAARKMAGLSMEKLAIEAGSMVSKQAISKYERGIMKPGSEVLLALANSLGVKVAYFLRPRNLRLTGLEFTKKSRLSVAEQDRIKYRTIDFLEKYLELEDILGAQPIFKNPVRNRRILGNGDIERAAEDIRNAWNLGESPIPQLTEILEDHGIKIVEVDAGADFDGLSGFAGEEKLPFIAIYGASDLVRKRFTIAHELAHLLLEFPHQEKQSSEKLCHAFAGALLLPEGVIREELGNRRKKITEWELKKLKGIYGISMQAVMARALNLDIISRQAYRQFCIYVNTHGWREKEPGKYSGVEKANRFKQLVLHAAAEQVISYSKAAELLNLSLSEFERKVSIVS
ncbi:MAG: ImmA/IrrE family metallo-endopeptidase [Deltaproteobacteria bacterium]|nr:ImmA/IrrE family metallo-endopeptidase [Deltaproteobacteria bacterium]